MRKDHMIHRFVVEPGAWMSNIVNPLPFDFPQLFAGMVPHSKLGP